MPRECKAILTEAQSSPDPVGHIVAWLACEGATLMSTFRLFDLPDDLRAQVCDRLAGMAKQSASP